MENDVIIEIDLRKSPSQNANAYFEKAKKSREKAEKGKEHLKALQRKLENAKKEKSKGMRIEWFMKYRWSFTSNNKLILCGRNKGQNEKLFRRQLKEEDIFFHADIKGAPTTILKDGKHADEKEIIEAATIAGIYSKAWSLGYVGVKVYWVGKEKIVKDISSPGAYNFKGKREWANVELKAYIGMREINNRKLLGLWASNDNIIGKWIEIKPGTKSKKDVIKLIRENISNRESEEYLMSILPPGGFGINNEG